MIEQICPMQPTKQVFIKGIKHPDGRTEEVDNPGWITVPTLASNSRNSSPRRIRNNHFIGVGSLVQLAGVFAPFGMYWLFGTDLAAVIGLAAGLLLMVIGNRMSKAWHCSACGTKLLNRGVTICPGCRQGLS